MCRWRGEGFGKETLFAEKVGGGRAGTGGFR